MHARLQAYVSSHVRQIGAARPDSNRSTSRLGLAAGVALAVLAAFARTAGTGLARAARGAVGHRHNGTGSRRCGRGAATIVPVPANVASASP